MPDRSSSTRTLLARVVVFSFASLLLNGTSLPAQQTVFGDLRLALESEQRGEMKHGYVEYRVIAKNTSPDKPHLVRLVMPGRSFGGGGGGGLAAITREAVVRPGTTRIISILQPAEPGMLGGDMAVYVDGRKQEDFLRVPSVSSGHRGGMYSSRRGIRSYAVKMSSPSGVGGDAQILLSQRVPEKFFDVGGRPRVGPGPGMAPMMPPPGGPGVPGGPPVPGGPGGGGPAGGPGDPGEMIEMPGMGGFPGGIGPGGVWRRFSGQTTRSELPISIWSGEWLAYTRYDGIILTKDDLDELRRAGTTQSVRDTVEALWRWVEAGGTMLVIDSDPPAKEKGKSTRPSTLDVPEAWAQTRQVKHGFAVYQVGFGRCFLSPNRSPNTWHHEIWSDLNSRFNETGTPWRSTRTLVDLNTNYPVVDELGVPVRGLFVLMIAFALLIGPGNLWLLSKWKRRIWLLWTVPALSAVFCLAVLGYMVVVEGWTGHARVGGVTILDEIGQRATTLGNCGFYSPLTPSDGIRFDMNTEVQVQGEEHSAYSSSCALDYNDETQQQHFSRGWVTARVPAYFTLRKSELGRKERMTTRREDDGSLSVRNDLGVDISKFYLADEKGQVYQGADLQAGQWTKLTRMNETVRTDWADRWRQFYHDGTGDWMRTSERLINAPKNALGPNTYLAVLEKSLFLEQPLKGAAIRPSRSVVLGLMAKK